MSNAYNLSLLASRNNLGNAGDAFISQGNDIAPSLGPLSAGVLSLSGINQLTGQIGVNKSTGVVTISAEPHLCELDVPGWDRGQHITQWSTLQKHLSATALTNRTIAGSAAFVEIFGNIPAAGAYAIVGGVLAPNGKIYLVPNSTTVGIIIDPITNSISTYPGPAGGNNYSSGVLAPNGIIHFAPRAALVGRCVNPADNTVTTYGSFPGTNAYDGSVVAPNGKIYLVPSDGCSIGRIVDPSNLTITTFGRFGVYSGAALGPNGKVYFIPLTATAVAVIDPDSNNGTSVKFFSGAAYSGFGTTWNADGAVLAPNGRIYLNPCAGNFVPPGQIGAFIEPSNDTLTTFPIPNFPTSYNGGLLGPNGKLYFTPGSTSIMLLIDPENNTSTTFGVLGYNGYMGGTSHPNGKIYLFPVTATSALALNILNNNNFNINICTNPMFNKY